MGNFIPRSRICFTSAPAGSASAQRTSASGCTFASRSNWISKSGLTFSRLPYINEALTDPKERVRFINYMQLRNFSSILHGEQGALNLSASLCHVLYDQGAQEYAANQTREEARHVTAFAKYVKARWGRPAECGATLKSLLVEIIATPEVYKKIVGMQMLIEGLAMGAFATGFLVYGMALVYGTTGGELSYAGIASKATSAATLAACSTHFATAAAHARSGLRRALRSGHWLNRLA